MTDQGKRYHAADIERFLALPGYENVRIRGEHRGEMFEERSKNGVPLHPKLVEALFEIASELDIPDLS